MQNFQLKKNVCNSKINQQLFELYILLTTKLQTMDY